jgi:hypothetical protein
MCNFVFVSLYVDCNKQYDANNRKTYKNFTLEPSLGCCYIQQRLTKQTGNVVYVSTNKQLCTVWMLLHVQQHPRRAHDLQSSPPVHRQSKKLGAENHMLLLKV